MIITNRALAEALINSVQKHPNEVGQICDNFIDFLRIKRRLASLPLILKTLEQVAQKRFGYKKVVVVSRFPISPDAIRAIERLVRKQTGASHIVIDNQFDEALVSGARIHFDDMVIDLTLKTQLEKLASENHGD